MDKKPLFAIFLVVFIGLLGFSIILPLLPYYAQTFGANPVLIGLLVASYAAAQLISAPILGRLSDRYGRRPILIVSTIGTFLSLIMIALAGNLWILFASRILDGLTGGNISVAQAYITDVTDARNRSRGLGLIGAAFGLGFIFGPALGGFLSQWGYALPAYAAAGLTMVSLVLILFWLPETLSGDRKIQIASTTAKQPAISLNALITALRRQDVGPLLHTRFFFSLAFSTFQGIFSLYTLVRFNLSAQNTGYVLTYVGVLSVIVQGFLVGRLAARFDERKLIFSSVVLMVIGCLGWALAPSLAVLLIALAPLSLAGGTLNTVINSAISQSAPTVEAGGLLGISASLESLTRVIAPSLSGLMLAKFSPSAPGIFSALILAWLATYTWRFLIRDPRGIQSPAFTRSVRGSQ